MLTWSLDEWVVSQLSYMKGEINLCVNAYICTFMYLWASLIVQLVKNPPAVQETRFNSWVGKIHWSKDRYIYIIYIYYVYIHTHTPIYKYIFMP